MKKGAILAPALLTILLLIVPKRVLAIDNPNFPACANPTGTKIVDVGLGVHGIVGDQNTYTGADKVYLSPEGNYTQCFCSVDGHGIQTSWWKISSLDPDQLAILKSEGWNYVSTGLPWGLPDNEFLAKNNSFSCEGSYGDGGNSENSNSLIGQVLGLAFTGNANYTYAFIGTGLFLITLGFVLTKSK